MENITNNHSLDYTALLADLEEKLANIEAERLAIEAKENALKESISSFKRLIAVESGEAVLVRRDDVVVPKRAFKGMVMIEAIEKYIRMAKTGRTAKQIVEGLRQGNLDTKSQHLSANVRTALKRQGPSRGIVRRSGMYWLAEWPYTPKEQGSDKQEETASTAQAADAQQ